MISTRTNPWLVFFALSLGFFVTIQDTTIVNIAVPSIMKDLNADFDQILWILNGYLLVYATLVITAGRLGEIFGFRKIYTIGLIMFILASALCGSVHAASQLIASRVFQGIGAALLAPQPLAILTTIFPRERRGVIFGSWSAVAGIATITAPMLGGYMVTNNSWRYIFFINLPFCILGLLLSAIIVPDINVSRHRNLDLIGVVLANLGLSAVVFSLIESKRYNWGNVWKGISIPGIMIAGISFLIFFVFWERTRSEPLIQLKLFQNRNFSIMNGVIMAISFGIIGSLLVVTIYLQSVVGMTALEAGQIIAPLSIVSMFVAPFAGRFTDKTGGRKILLMGLLLFASEIGIIAWISSSKLITDIGLSNGLGTFELLFLIPILLGGLGLGCIISPSTTIAMRSVDVEMAGTASGVLSATRQLGYLLGSAVTGSILQSQFVTTLNKNSNIYLSQIPSQFHQQFFEVVNNTTRKGLYLIDSETASILNLPQQIEQQFKIVFDQIFEQSFIEAMQPTLMSIIVVLLIVFVSCLAIIDDRKEKTYK